MHTILTLRAIVVMLALLATLPFASLSVAAQPSAEDTKLIEHAKQLFQSIRDNKHDAVAKEFNDKMAAAMPIEKLSGAWASVLQQTGAFKAIIDEQVQRPQAGFTAVILGSQFENASVNAMFVFDEANKVAGISFRPRK